MRRRAFSLFGLKTPDRHGPDPGGSDLANRPGKSASKVNGRRAGILSSLIACLLIVAAPQVSHAGDEEDALGECLLNAITDWSFGAGPVAVGCIAGYASSKVDDEEEEDEDDGAVAGLDGFFENAIRTIALAGRYSHESHRTRSRRGPVSTVVVPKDTKRRLRKSHLRHRYAFKKHARHIRKLRKTRVHGRRVLLRRKGFRRSRHRFGRNFGRGRFLRHHRRGRFGFRRRGFRAFRGFHGLRRRGRLR
jgi:hypothetical protein